MTTTMHNEETTQAEHTEKQHLPQTKKTMWSWLWRAGIVLLVLILSPLVFLSTDIGQRSLLQMVDKWSNGLVIGRIEGNIRSGLKLADTQFQADGINVNVGEVDLHIGFQCLLSYQACVENLSLRNTSIEIDTHKLSPSTPKEDKPIGEIKLPLAVLVKKVELDNINVKVDGLDIDIKHFHTGLTGQERQFVFSPTQLEGLRLSLPMQAVENEQHFATKSPAAEPIDWEELKTQLSEPLLTRLNPIKLPLDIKMADFEAKSIQLERKTANGADLSLLNVDGIRLQAASDQKSITLQEFVFKSDKGFLQAKGELKLADNYPFEWVLNTNISSLPEFQLPASKVGILLSGELFGTTQLSLKTEGAIVANLQGNIQLSEPKAPFHLELRSQEMHYPLMLEKGQEVLHLDQIDFAVGGDLLDYQLKAKFNASGMGIPKSSLQLSGLGGLTHFDVADLTLNMLQGQAKLTGQLDWHDGVEWQSKLQLDNLHTKSLVPEWAAVLSGGLQSNGYVARGKQREQWQAEVSDLDLQGNLFQKTLQLTGSFSANHQTLLTVPALHLIYGENRIDLKGIISENSDFNANINAPNLKGLIPHFSAAAQGKIKLFGKVSEPALDLDLNVANVSYDQLKLQQLSAKGKVSSEKEIHGDLAIGLRQFVYGDVKIANANLTVTGSEANHQLKLLTQGEPVRSDLHILGKFDRLQQRWQGQLQNVVIGSPVGEWKNDKAIAMAYHHTQMKADIAAHCWHNPKLQLCFPQQFNAGKEGKIPFEIKQFDLTMLQSFLTKDTQLSGLVNAKGNVAWFADKAPQLNVELLSNSIKLAQKINYKTFPLHITPLKITVKLIDNQLDLQTDIQFEQNGHISSDLVMKDIANKRALSGKVNIDSLNLKLISPLLNAGEKVGGAVNARLTLGGTALAPLLYGNLSLNTLKASASVMPFEVVNGGLTLNFHGSTSTLSGNVQTKEGNLVLDGDANWQKLEAWHTRINAKAERFRLSIPNMAKVDISPNIEVKATPRELILSGKIDIPWARIAVEALPESAVAVSSDEVIMEEKVKSHQQVKTMLMQPPPTQTATGMLIKANVDIHVGDDVKIDAYGLKSHLKGTVKVRQGEKGLGLYGQVNLNNGTFASFGQDLVIRKGLISFTGAPTQPTLDIEAIRNPEAIEDSKVTAGVKVTGIADAPDVKLFSSPSMSQDQILSYILTGRGLEGSGDAGSSNSIAAALIGMSLSKSSKMVGGVGSAFGISDLNVTTAGIGDNTKVVVSGSLTPKFKVKYGVGIFAPLTELTLRYRLAPSLYLQWVSSINQAVDLMYRFEFD